MLRRCKQLDALRGLAAAVVVTVHMEMFVNNDGKTGLFRTVVSPYISGQAAVVLFFVLSGFVLSLPYLAGSNQHYFSYVVRRFCRLYIPFAVAVLVSVASLYMVYHFADLPIRNNDPTFWERPLSTHALASDLLMSGYPPDGIRLDPPIWSLIVEMRASLIFPLLVVAGVRYGWLGVALGIPLALGSAKLRAAMGDTSAVDATTACGTLLLTSRYLVFFLLGILCATRMRSISALMRQIPPWLHVIPLLGALGLTLLIARERLINRSYIDLCYGAFAVYLIACCVEYGQMAKLLMHRWLQWLGKVSFSLYLIHWPVLMVAYYLLSRKVPEPVVQAVSIPAILLSARIMERWVERPSHALGRRLSRQIETSMGGKLAV